MATRSAPGLDLSRLGGFVTAPVTRRPVHGQPPQVIEGPGGLLWQRGRWNPGIRNVLRDHAALWRRSPAPVIVHIAGDEPDELAAVAEALEKTPGVAGLEIDLFTMQLDSIFDMADTAAELVKAVRRAADLPLLARLPLSLIDEAIEPVLEAGVDALVLAQPPAGLRLDPGTSVTVRGGMHGPALDSTDRGPPGRASRLGGRAPGGLRRCAQPGGRLDLPGRRRQGGADRHCRLGGSRPARPDRSGAGRELTSCSLPPAAGLRNARLSGCPARCRSL